MLLTKTRQRLSAVHKKPPWLGFAVRWRPVGKGQHLVYCFVGYYLAVHFGPAYRTPALNDSFDLFELWICHNSGKGKGMGAYKNEKLRVATAGFFIFFAFGF